MAAPWIRCGRPQSSGVGWRRKDQKSRRMSLLERRIISNPIIRLNIKSGNQAIDLQTFLYGARERNPTVLQVIDYPDQYFQRPAFTP
jgi:hypothetical protein